MPSIELSNTKVSQPRTAPSQKDDTIGLAIVGLIALLIFILKLVLSYHVYGTNDVTYWIHFARTIENAGTLKIYSLVEIYNHSPLISWTLKAVLSVARLTGLGFPFVLRLLPITADLFSIALIWALLGSAPLKTRVKLCVLCALNPINLLVAGFHGNTDPVFIMVLLATLLCVSKQKIVLAGVFFGLSLCIKLVPVLLAPVFFFRLAKTRSRSRFFWAAAIIPAIVFLPYLIGDFRSVWENVLFYTGPKGCWGILLLLTQIRDAQIQDFDLKRTADSLYNLYLLFGKPLTLLSIVLVSKFSSKSPANGLVRASFLVFACFLTFTPGFGVQYLCWLSYFAIMTTPLWGTLYALASGLFIYRSYCSWGGNLPPYYANAIGKEPWVGPDATLSLLVWALIAGMLILHLFKRDEKRPCL